MASKDHSLDSGIAQAAYKEFLTCGFQKASLHKIAENAGVTTGAIYTRYQNKDALFVSLLQGFFKTMEEIFSPAEQEYERARKSARAEDIIRRSREDGEFSAIISEASKVMGRTLSSVDMKILFGIYDYLGLPADVIMLLINYCARQYEERYGGQRRPSARAIEKEAYFWVNREIMTMEQAEDFIRRMDERRGSIAGIKNALGIKGRELTKTEIDYISSWLDLGFGAEAISIAYDRTVTNTGSLRWSYMNKIILSWKEKGLLTPRDIEEKDGRRPARTAPRKGRGSRPSDFEGLDSLIDKV